jgi:hypothetical protein
MKKNEGIILYVFLISEDGTLDLTLTKATCILTENVTVNEKSEETQAQLILFVKLLD